MSDDASATIDETGQAEAPAAATTAPAGAAAITPLEVRLDRLRGDVRVQLEVLGLLVDIGKLYADMRDDDRLVGAMPMIKLILPILLLTIATSLCCAAAPRPSFDCHRAQTPDEIAICSDAHLSELDRIYARDFKILKEKDRKQAAKQAHDFMKFRRLCGNDRFCILERMQYLHEKARLRSFVR